MGTARWLGVYMSSKVPPTRIVPTQPKRPSRARHTMMVTMFWPSARPLNMMAKRR